MLFQVTDLKLLSSLGLKKICALFYHARNILLRSTKGWERKRLVHDFWRNNHEKQFSSPSWTHSLKVSTRHTKSYLSEFLSFFSLKLPSCPLVIFINMNMYMLTDGMSFRIFLKRNRHFQLASWQLLLIY